MKVYRGKQHMYIALSVKVRGCVHLLLVIYVPDTLYHTDQPAEVRCVTCMDDYCDVCFYAQHRKGSRKQHPRSLF